MAAVPVVLEFIGIPLFLFLQREPCLLRLHRLSGSRFVLPAYSFVSKEFMHYSTYVKMKTSVRQKSVHMPSMHTRSCVQIPVCGLNCLHRAAQNLKR